MEKEINKPEVLEKGDEKGASMLEYALLAALIAVVCIAIITLVGQSVSQTFSGVASAI